jgi:hypothetical protein
VVGGWTWSRPSRSYMDYNAHLAVGKEKFSARRCRVLDDLITLNLIHMAPTCPHTPERGGLYHG